MSSVEAAYFKNMGDPVHCSVNIPFRSRQDHLVGTIDVRERRVLSRIVRNCRLAAQVLIQAGVIEQYIAPSVSALRSCFNGAGTSWPRKTFDAPLLQRGRCRVASENAGP